MSNEEYISLLSLEMVNNKMLTQILCAILPKEESNAWLEAHKRIEEQFNIIKEQRNE